MQGLLDKLDVIECFEKPAQKLRVGEILKNLKAEAWGLNRQSRYETAGIQNVILLTLSQLFKNHFFVKNR